MGMCWFSHIKEKTKKGNDLGCEYMFNWIIPSIEYCDKVSGSRISKLKFCHFVFNFSCCDNNKLRYSDDNC